MAESSAVSPTITQPANALRKAIDEIRRVRARRQVADALNTRNVRAQQLYTT